MTENELDAMFEARTDKIERLMIGFPDRVRRAQLKSALIEAYRDGGEYLQAVRKAHRWRRFGGMTLGIYVATALLIATAVPLGLDTARDLLQYAFGVWVGAAGAILIGYD